MQLNRLRGWSQLEFLWANNNLVNKTESGYTRWLRLTSIFPFKQMSLCINTPHCLYLWHWATPDFRPWSEVPLWIRAFGLWTVPHWRWVGQLNCYSYHYSVYSSFLISCTYIICICTQIVFKTVLGKEEEYRGNYILRGMNWERERDRVGDTSVEYKSRPIRKLSIYSFEYRQSIN